MRKSNRVFTKVRCRVKNEFMSIVQLSLYEIFNANKTFSKMKILKF